MTARKSMDTTYYYNLGWGLGTMYDSTVGGSCNSDRPMTDAQMHVDSANWGCGASGCGSLNDCGCTGSGGSCCSSGATGGIGGRIGLDNECRRGCPWDRYSGFDYDYAIFVGVNSPPPPPASSSAPPPPRSPPPSPPPAPSIPGLSFASLSSAPDATVHWQLALNIDTSDGACRAPLAARPLPCAAAARLWPRGSTIG